MDGDRPRNRRCERGFQQLERAMFPAARKLDPVTHDLLVPSGIIGPPLAGPCPAGLVLIEGLPAAHVTCTAICTGAVTGGLAHPPPPGPPPPIATGSPTVFIHNMLAARWVPSGDIAGCLAFLGDPKLVAIRTVFIGNGAVHSLQIRVVIVKGSSYDSPEGRARIARMIARMQEVTGMQVGVASVETVDNDAYLDMSAYGPWDGRHNYTGGECLTALNEYGDPDTPTAIFTDDVSGTSGPVRGSTTSRAWAGTEDEIPNEGIVVADSADDETFTHEMGHLLTGLSGDDLHSDDPDNIMAGGETGRSEWTDPWASESENSPYVTPPEDGP